MGLPRARRTSLSTRRPPPCPSQLGAFIYVNPSGSGRGRGAGGVRLGEDDVHELWLAHDHLSHLVALDELLHAFLREYCLLELLR